MSCSMNSGSFDKEPRVRVPNLPSSVKYTEPKLPDKSLKGPKETSELLKEYEKADQSNKFAIEQAQKHNLRLQRTYNKKRSKK